jgi:soluble lytic murein transglycosylase
MATRDAGEVQVALDLLERVEKEYPRESWAEDALDALADYYLKKGIDDRADEYFRQLYERYPRGKNSERAAWKIGWTSYRAANYPDTILVFERAAADFARSDYRPGWLYWAGRAHEQLGDLDVAEERYTLAAADYMNSYYGRLALGRMAHASAARIVAARNSVADRAPSVPALPPNGPTVRELLSAGMFDDALSELQYAQKVWGDSPAIQATVAWTSQQQARTESGMRRFQLLRGAINAMRRAYPQFLTAGGEELPREVLTVIFPIAYWDSIRTHAEEYGLDPYLVAALVAQESTFTADVKSYANAYGLMQLLPSTARQYARKLNLPYSSRLLVDPESNVRMGTAYLADKVREFGDVHLALASYNAGERAVHRWQAERPGLETDEFIDDIPYPQTQNYVKRILGTADDYRRVYGNAASIQGVETTRKPSVPAVADAAPKKSAPAPKAPPKKSAAKKSTRKS